MEDKGFDCTAYGCSHNQYGDCRRKKIDPITIDEDGICYYSDIPDTEIELIELRAQEIFLNNTIDDHVEQVNSLTIKNEELEKENKELLAKLKTYEI